jgi:putative transposase
MARTRRHLQSNVVYHVFNRRTDKQCLFPSAAAYEDSLDVLARANEKFEARLHAYCLLHSHVHLAASAEDPAVLRHYLQWIFETHAVRFRFQTATRGYGHVYQDRYKSKPIDGAVHYVTVIRYIEANPREARLVARAQDWRWSSLRERVSGRERLIQPGPWGLPDRWVQLVNTVDVAIHEVPALLGQLSAFRPGPTAFPEFS